MVDPPHRGGLRPQVERQRDGRAPRPLDITPEIEAVLRADPTLIAPTRFLAQDIGIAQPVQLPRWREAEQDRPSGRLPPAAADPNLPQAPLRNCIGWMRIERMR